MHPYNITAVTIYKDCSNQYISAGNSVVGINLASANVVMDWYEIEIDERPDIWAKITSITDQVIKECTEEAERKAKEKRNHGKANY